MSYYENLPFFVPVMLSWGCFVVDVWLFQVSWAGGKEGSKAHWIIYACLYFLKSVASASDTHVHEVEDGVLQSLFHVLISLPALFVCSFFL